MSVLVVGGHRFAAGLDWEREVLRGGKAAKAARDRGHRWTVELGGQTGFLGDIENPGGLAPLAGALVEYVRKRPEGRSPWTAFIEEDGEGDGPKRVGVVRSSGGAVLPGGDGVFQSAAEAQRALGTGATQGVRILATPGLAALFEEAATVEPSSIAAAAKDLPVLVEAPKGSLSKAATWAAALLLVAGGAGYAGWQYYDDILKLAGYGKKEPEEPPTVEAVVVTPTFLRWCQAGWDGLRVRMAGFDRRAVVCHPRFAGSEAGASWGAGMGRPVLEVRWQLREGLDPRVYEPMARDMLRGWPKAFIDDNGASVALVALPSVLVKHDPEAGRLLEPTQFRDLLDRTLALRGFDIEYTEFGADVEAVLGTGRPLREAVAMLSAMEGVEVASVSWSEEGGWRFGVRRTRSFMMLESEFDALTQADAAGAAADRTAGRSG